MSSPTTPAAGRAVEDRASNEFARVVNLSDAVFAIAMTLLVLTVDVPDVASSGLAAALFADLPQLGAYALAFVLVASQWYAHRKLFQRPAFTEVGLTIINLAFLGLVALVPFPTSVLGSYPLATAAVIAFLATFALLARAARPGANQTRLARAPTGQRLPTHPARLRCEHVAARRWDRRGHLAARGRTRPGPVQQRPHRPAATPRHPSLPQLVLGAAIQPRS